jgi:hypothetical protein
MLLSEELQKANLKKIRTKQSSSMGKLSLTLEMYSENLTEPIGQNWGKSINPAAPLSFDNLRPKYGLNKN